MELLQCKNLSVGYGSQAVAENLNFSLETGEYLVILGDNGSGKTTLMRTLLGIIPPLSGEVVKHFSGAGYLPQYQGPNLFPATVREIVLSGIQNRPLFKPFYSHMEKERARSALDTVGMADKFKAPFSGLSFGQKQRVLLARALCAMDRILLLDEPITGLDPESAENLYALIRELCRQGIAVVMISHDLSEVLKDADLVLALGNLPFFGTVEEYLERRDVR